MIPFFDEKETNAVVDYMNSGGFMTEFQKTTEFELMIQEYVGSKHAIVVNNGTVSLSLMLMALGVGHGDEVIVPNYTMIATPNSVKMVGAEPIFVDVEASTLCLDIKEVEAKISPRTRVVLLVSANGRYPSYGVEALIDLCKARNIVLLEDAAQAMGSYFPDGLHIGRAGQIGSFSFSVPKIISTGQGGCLVTDDDELAHKLRRLKDFGRSQGGNDIHDTIGFNFKFTDLQACIGIEQMKKLGERVKRKKQIWDRFSTNLFGEGNVQFFGHDLKSTAPWFMDVLVANRSELVQFLKSNEIGTRPMYPPINRQKAYNYPGDFPVSNDVGKRGLWLPSFVQITDNEIDFVCEKIMMFYSKLNRV
jgi:perosamine synthetase